MPCQQAGSPGRQEASPSPPRLSRREARQIARAVAYAPGKKKTRYKQGGAQVFCPLMGAPSLRPAGRGARGARREGAMTR